MKTIAVQASKSYEITIGAGLLDDAGATIRKISGGQTAAVITDDRVNSLYGNRLIDSLAKNGYRTARYIFPNGEASKHAETFFSMLNFLASEHLSRDDVVVALGGGVVGDLAGFAAACYMRGCRFIQVPTTLLAAVDSSVGGKTGINLSAGKNMAGVFYQPDAVICDVALLSTLSEEVFRDGLAEIIKYGMIADWALLEALEKPVDTQMEAIIARCVEIKRDIVMMDEFERETRKLLNFGHTVGHAIEKLSGYHTTHGHAVAAGMAIVTRAAVGMGLCGQDCLDKLLYMLKQFGLPNCTEYRADELASICLSDKKRAGDSLTMVFPVEIGQCVLRGIPVGELETIIGSGL